MYCMKYDYICNIDIYYFLTKYTIKIALTPKLRGSLILLAVDWCKNSVSVLQLKNLVDETFLL